jgi:hypothetical protein
MYRLQATVLRFSYAKQEQRIGRADFIEFRGNCRQQTVAEVAEGDKRRLKSLPRISLTVAAAFYNMVCTALSCPRRPLCHHSILTHTRGAPSTKGDPPALPGRQ